MDFLIHLLQTKIKTMPQKYKDNNKQMLEKDIRIAYSLSAHITIAFCLYTKITKLAIKIHFQNVTIAFILIL
jgi:hypothetical protein